MLRVLALILVGLFAYAAISLEGWVPAAAVFGAFFIGALIWPLARDGRDREASRAMEVAEAQARVRDLDPALVESVSDLVAAGRKIEAIRELREATGIGLKEAKQTVEAMIKNMSVRPTSGRDGKKTV